MCVCVCMWACLRGVSATVKKNWDPFVPGPEFAIDSNPGFECATCAKPLPRVDGD